MRRRASPQIARIKYTQRLLVELRDMARNDQNQLLSYFIDLAYLEATELLGPAQQSEELLASER